MRTVPPGLGIACHANPALPCWAKLSRAYGAGGVDSFEFRTNAGRETAFWICFTKSSFNTFRDFSGFCRHTPQMGRKMG